MLRCGAKNARPGDFLSHTGVLAVRAIERDFARDKQNLRDNNIFTDIGTITLRDVFVAVSAVQVLVAPNTAAQRGGSSLFLPPVPALGCTRRERGGKEERETTRALCRHSAKGQSS